MKTHLRKLSDVKHATQLVVEQSVAAAYIRVMAKNSTTSGITAQAVYAVYQCVWSVVMRIEYANPNVIDHLTKHLKL